MLASAPLRLRTYGAFVAWVRRPLLGVRFRSGFSEGRLTHAERGTRLRLALGSGVLILGNTPPSIPVGASRFDFAGTDPE